MKIQYPRLMDNNNPHRDASKAETDKCSNNLGLPPSYLKSFFHNMPQGAAIFQVVDNGADFLFSDFNPAAETIENISKEEVLGRSVKEVFPGIEDLGLLAVFTEVYRTQKPLNHPISFYKDDRLSGWRENFIFPLSDNEIATIYQDATAEKTIEEEVRLGREKYRAIFSTVSDAIMVHDELTGRILEVNDAMLRMYGCTEEQALAAQPDDFSLGTTPYSSAEVADLISQVRATGTKTFTWHARRYDGSLFWVQVQLSHTKISTGNRVIAVVRDLTKEKRQQELADQIQHVQKLESLGILAGGIAHDFNNIMMTILGNTELALHDLSPVSPVRHNLETIETSSHRAADLCRQLLAYSGKGRFVIEGINLSDLLREMTNMLRVSLSKKTNLNLNLADDMPVMEGDATQIRQVVMNLVINASEALENKDGLVNIVTGSMSCSRDYLDTISFASSLDPGPFCFLEISDNGCGMDRKTIDRIFEPFFTTKFTGRGLGLAAALGIVRSHQGALKIYSEINKGSSFKVLFPVKEILSSPVNTKATFSDRKWTGKGLVLVVDDEEQVLETAVRMLNKIGFQCLQANNGKEALKIYKERQKEIGLLLMDLTMPQMDGEETFQALRILDPGIKVILSSGYNQQELSQKSVGKGLASFLQKPYQMNELRQAIIEAFS